VLPFHRAVVADPAFAAPGGVLRVHTRWIETEFDTPMPAQETTEVVQGSEPAERERLTVEVGVKRLEVVVPAGLARGTGSQGAERARSSRRATGRSAPAGGGATLLSPMQGTIIKIAAAEGQRVSAGD